MTAIPNRSAVPSGPAQLLHQASAAVRVSLRWFGVRKTLSPQQKDQAAETFGAEGQLLSAAKKLLDTRHPAYKAVTTIRNRAVGYWRAISLPYPEPGIRLIRQADLQRFNQRLDHFRGELDEAVLRLDQCYAQLKTSARSRLGSLYNESDYPPTLRGLFALEWDFPSIEPPDYLRRLSPQLFEQEQKRIAARFDEAVRMAEEAFTAEFAKVVGHLAERLQPGKDGKLKTFRDSAVGNLQQFFSRFQMLNVHSNEELDHLVEQAQQLVKGIGAQDLRDQEHLRTSIQNQLAAMQSSLESLVVDRPRRRILRLSPSGISGGQEGAA